MGQALNVGELKVLVVEDHGFQRRMALRMLAELGVEQVWEAADGAAALGVLHGMPALPDLVLVDLDMPGMDGVEFIGHIAERHLAKGVALVSAMDQGLLNAVQSMARAHGLRVLGSIEKPLSLAKLRNLFDALGERHPGSEDEVPVDVSREEMREALLHDQLVAWFQPQAECTNGKVVAVEALARWRRPDGHVVRPGNFIHLLERDGHGQRLTDTMLAQACRWKRRWEDDHGLRLQVSVNVSAAALAEPGAADHYHALVRDLGVEPADLVLEITEGSLVSDAARGLGVLARLRLKGFGLAIDDFGTGYSSLAQLSQIPFTELKIDQDFVSGAGNDPRKRAVIEASLDLARKLQLEVVAEGVESPEDWQLLAELGCGFAQGYLIGAAVPGEDLPGAISRWRRPAA